MTATVVRLDEKKRSDFISSWRKRSDSHAPWFPSEKDLSPALADRLEKTLLSMHENDQGRKILRNTDDTTKFDLLPEGDAGLRRRLAEIFQSAKKN